MKQCYNVADCRRPGAPAINPRPVLSIKKNKSRHSDHNTEPHGKYFPSLANNLKFRHPSRSLYPRSKNLVALDIESLWLVISAAAPRLSIPLGSPQTYLSHSTASTQQRSTLFKIDIVCIINCLSLSSHPSNSVQIL